MASFSRAIEVRYSPRQMYDLVDRIEDYPQFLPWCSGSEVERGEGGRVLATLHLRRGSLRHSFATRNVHDADALDIQVRLARGPLAFLKGEWRFEDCGDGGCRVSFEIDYRFSSRMLDAILGPMFAIVYERMIDAFAARADQVYGRGENSSADEGSPD